MAPEDEFTHLYEEFLSLTQFNSISLDAKLILNEFDAKASITKQPLLAGALFQRQ